MLKTETIMTCSDGRKFINDPEGASKHEEALQNVDLIHKFIETELKKVPGQRSHKVYTTILVKWEAFRLAIDESEDSDDDTVLEAVGGTA